MAALLHSSSPLVLPQRRGSKVQGRTTQFTRWRITVSTQLAASLATAIQLPRCPHRERACVRPWEPIFQSEGAICSPLIHRTAGGCRSRRVRARTWPPETRDELSVNMPPSDMKENNVCSKAVGGDYAGADWRSEERRVGKECRSR